MEIPNLATVSVISHRTNSNRSLRERQIRSSSCPLSAQCWVTCAANIPRTSLGTTTNNRTHIKGSANEHSGPCAVPHQPDTYAQGTQGLKGQLLFLVEGRHHKSQSAHAHRDGVCMYDMGLGRQYKIDPSLMGVSRVARVPPSTRVNECFFFSDSWAVM